MSTSSDCDIPSWKKSHSNVNWIEICLERIQERNMREVYRNQQIYYSNSILWNENLQLKAQFDDVSQSLAILQHEMSQLLADDDMTAAASLCYKKLFRIQDRLRQPELHFNESASLPGIVSEQLKLISDLKDELTVSKSELLSHQEKVIYLEKEIDIMKQSFKRGGYDIKHR